MNKKQKEPTYTHFDREMNHFFVLTGGPGTGKTSLIEVLKQHGFQTVPEDARRIIQEQVAMKGDGLPWANKMHYANLMFEAALNSYTLQKSNSNTEPVFFDRGHLDSICYMKMEQLPLSEQVLEQTRKYPYNKCVFILPPWKEIYITDAERKQSWEEVLFTHEQMKETYAEFSYTVIELPKTSLKNRLRFITDFLNL